MDELLYGQDLFGAIAAPPKGGPLAARFEFPPFSVLNAREGAWQERKRAWLALGIQSELGRGGNSSPGGSPRPAMDYSKNERGDGYGKAFSTQHLLSDGSPLSTMTGTSIFDPVLCELAYRWFCPPGGQVLDPFAGGSVRGLLAGLLGLRYCGIELRHEQVQANAAQRAAIAPEADVDWVCGDAIEMLPLAPEADFIFSCPPMAISSATATIRAI